MGTQIQTFQNLERKCITRELQSVRGEVPAELVQPCVSFSSVSLKTLLLFILKFNVNVTILIPNITECGHRLTKIPDWSSNQISASDWLIDIPNASRQDQNSFLTGTLLQKENSNANNPAYFGLTG